MTKRFETARSRCSPAWRTTTVAALDWAFPVLLLGMILLAGCAANASPTASATESIPTFDLADLPAPPAGAAPPQVRTYLADVAAYTTPAMIVYARDFPVEHLDAIVAALEALAVPAEMVPAHQTLLEGYRSLAEGRRIAVENIGDNQLQAEARSLADFGQVQLQEHVQIVETYLAALRATPVP